MKPTNHGQEIGARIEDAVAEIVVGDCDFPVSVDDQIRVFENFPGGLHKHCDGEAEAERPFAEEEPREHVKHEAMQNVGWCVPVGEVLRVLGAFHHAVPELYIAAFADGFPAHQQQYDDCSHGDQDG